MIKTKNIYYRYQINAQFKFKNLYKLIHLSITQLYTIVFNLILKIIYKQNLRS